MKLARKITRAKWQASLALRIDEVPTRCPRGYSELRATPLWDAEDGSPLPLEQVALAVAAAGDHLERLDIAWLPRNTLVSAGITLKATTGNTPVQSLRERHVDAKDLDSTRLVKIAAVLFESASRRWKRLTKLEVKKLIQDAIDSNLPRPGRPQREYSESLECAKNTARRIIRGQISPPGPTAFRGQLPNSVHQDRAHGRNA